jgi:hypothetical protein
MGSSIMTIHGLFVFFFNSCPDDQRPFHFCTIACENQIESVQWISENRVSLRVALDLFEDEGGRIEIWEIDESRNSAQIVKRFQHEDVSFVYPLIYHCTMHILFQFILLLFHLGWDNRYGLGQKDEMFGRLFTGRMDGGKLSLFFC